MKYVSVLVLLLAGVCAWPQDQTLQRLEKSSRHQEWVTVKNGDRPVNAFVVFPERKDKAAVVILIHENRGLSDWVRGVADQLAEAGYIAIAPDLLSGMGPNAGRTKDFASEDAAREAIYQLKPDQVTGDLDAVADYARKIPAANGRVAVAGFCWGGGQTFRFATHRKDLFAAFVFYGSFEYTKDDIQRISCPVYGFYGGNDERIGATLPGTEEAMKAAGKTFEPVTYEGAGHGFMRTGEDASGSDADRKARSQAWSRWMSLLSK